MKSLRMAGVCLAIAIGADVGPARCAGIPLTLPEAVGMALLTNPALAAAEGRESAAWAGHDRTASERWPQLQLDSRVARVSEVAEIQLPGLPAVSLADQDTWVASATLRQLLYAGGRVSSLVRQAGSGAEAARAARVRARQMVAFGAERAFLLLLAAQEEIVVAAKNLAAAESHLRVANERLASRAAARFDVLRAEVQLEEARQEAIRADGGRLAAHALLLQALGLPGGDFWAVAPPRPASESVRPGPGELLDAARRLRPDLLGLQLQTAAAEAGVGVARAERLPTIAVSADYLYATPESQTLFSRWSLSAAVSVPVLDGGRAAARRAEAAAALVQAKAARDAQLRAVEAEVRQALARVASADAQVVVGERRITQAEELLRLAEVRFSGGAGTATEVADAQASLARARYGLTRAFAEQGIAAAELALAAGLTVTGEEASPAPPAPPVGREGGPRRDASGEGVR